VEAYLEHKLKLRPDEEFELIDVNGDVGNTENENAGSMECMKNAGE
jgi:hypothetical protein